MHKLTSLIAGLLMAGTLSAQVEPNAGQWKTWIALQSMASDAGTSTFDALIHTQLDVSTGLALGGQAGQQVVAHAQTDGAN